MPLDLRRRESADPWGLVGFSNDLSPEALLAAYRAGVFPWPDRTVRGIPWFCPPERGVLDFHELHVPRSLRTARKRTSLTFTFDRACPAVIAACASTKRPNQPGTWILPEIQKAYGELHRRGHVHSVEAWDGSTLVGGLYGVDSGGVFSGESMMHRVPNASKLCLLHMIDHLSGRGLEWMDTEVVTPHMEVLGAKLIPRSEFLARLTRDLEAARELFPTPA